jgi:hypothetical protein
VHRATVLESIPSVYISIVSNMLIHKLVVCMSQTPIRNSVLSRCSASDVSLLQAMKCLVLSNAEKKRYLNPVRDLSICNWILERIDAKDNVILIGKDIDLLVDRIRNPLGYHAKGLWNNPIVIWPVVATTSEHCDAFMSLPGHYCPRSGEENYNRSGGSWRCTERDGQAAYTIGYHDYTGDMQLESISTIHYYKELGWQLMDSSSHKARYRTSYVELSPGPPISMSAYAIPGPAIREPVVHGHPNHGYSTLQISMEHYGDEGPSDIPFHISIPLHRIF